ncbi:hypothetical protein [Nonomuraea rubra]|uniref:Uncharacterized protein n=1 Tax=Nonomuraea rubra TaxID=46180 RepID=A0A7X0NP12_9ACTN|nr:hypothetical protein [Nonomuraea rubra]MBB6546941.1 hypothetical protein [Nonomuraea rubra]
MLIGAFGCLPALAGGAITLKAMANSKQVVRNHEYSANLWRNVPVERLFPDMMGIREAHARERRPQDGRGWRRMAVSEETACGRALSGQLGELAAAHGCRSAVRATYLDVSGGTAATVAIVTFKDTDGVKELEHILEEAQSNEADYGVRALPARGTQWKDAARAGSGGTFCLDRHTPVFVAVTAGPADGRKAGKLPFPWGKRDWDQRADRSPWGYSAVGLAQEVAAQLVRESRAAQA